MKHFLKYTKHLYFSFFSLMLAASDVQAQGLQRAKSVLELIKTEILSIAPIIATIALIGIGIGYAMNMVQKETFMRWAAGLIIVGCASALTRMLLPN